MMSLGTTHQPLGEQPAEEKILF